MDVATLWFAMRDPRVPWYAKALGAVVVGYALSPIDLIPDFIPVLGLLDDLVLVPLGVLAIMSLVPRDVLADCRVRARTWTELPRSRVAAVVIVALWIALVMVAVRWFLRRAGSS
jgi:uncharacterized membrane protein YkvA (DUF1232 family)